MSAYQDWKKDILNFDLSLDEIVERWSGKNPFMEEGQTSQVDDEAKRVRVLKLLEEARKKVGL